VLLPAGTVAEWFRSERVVRCVACVDGTAEIQAENPAENPAETPVARPLPAPSPTTAAGAPGGSARREYEKRSAKEQQRKEAVVAEDAQWRARAKEKHPIGGRIVSALTPRPTIGPESQPTTAWAVGAEGEERVAEALGVAPGVIALHDRLVPGSKANIDHIAIAPTGVFVIDAKKYDGKVEIRTVGGLFSARDELWVGNRNQTKLATAMDRQVQVVRSALGPEWTHVPVHPVLCFVEAEWGLFPRPKKLGKVRILWPTKLTATVGEPGDWATHVPTIASRLDRALLPAT
jgi:hypothetical protein